MLIFIFVAAAGAVTFYAGPRSGEFDKASLTIPKSPGTARRCQHAQPGPGGQAGDGKPGLRRRRDPEHLHRAERRPGGRPDGPAGRPEGQALPGAILPMEPGEFTRSGGVTLPGNQVASWARVNNDGTHVTVWVLVAPHHHYSSDAGLYSGAVALDSRTVQGANVPVHVHIEYQNRNFVLAFGFIAAFFGFIWAWLRHNIDGGRPTNQGYFFRHLALCLAVLLAATIPIVNVQVLAKPTGREP